MNTLQPGQRFPEIAARSTGGDELRIPGSLRGGDAVLLFYRGHW